VKSGFCSILTIVILSSGCAKVETAANASRPVNVTPVEKDLISLPANSPKLTRIRVEAVRAMSFPSEEVMAPGKVEANPNRISRVVMPVGGRVREVLVRLGDSVVEGQPLLVVDSQEAGAAMTAYRQAQAQLRQAVAAQSKADKDLARIRELYQHRVAALKEITAAENDQAQARSAIEQSQAACDDAVHRLELLGLKPGQMGYVTVRAPLPGKVLDISVVPGEYRNDTNAPLMTIADLSTVWIAADVPESMIRRVEKGELIEVELSAYPGQILRGRVTRIADTVDPQSRAVKVQAEIANPGGRLRPEMYGQIRHNHGAVMRPALPSGAVLQKNGRNLILVEESSGRFRERTVEIGVTKGELVPVVSGVVAGERVVVDGAMLLGKD
jgi:cobalt-zinc-cadmium efflux system membrane fusion protein